MNLPLHELKKIETLIPDKTSPVYVYCLSGARSKRSAALMGHMGIYGCDGYGWFAWPECGIGEIRRTGQKIYFFGRNAVYEVSDGKRTAALENAAVLFMYANTFF